jgi:hypothetical protein
MNFKRFSLRALLLLVTAVCIFLGYEMNWVHQRRAFLAEQEEKRKACPALEQLQAGSSEVASILKRQAPRFLNLFGERGQGTIWMVFSGPDEEITSNHPVYVRAQRLFPESHIVPMLIRGRDEMDVVFIRDAATGEVVKGSHDAGKVIKPPLSESPDR